MVPRVTLIDQYENPLFHTELHAGNPLKQEFRNEFQAVVEVKKAQSAVYRGRDTGIDSGSRAEKN